MIILKAPKRLSVPREVFTSAFKRALVSSALIGLSIFVFIVLVVFFLSMRLFINPIKELVEGTRRLGHGDLSHRIRISGRDEIAKLAEEFNRMAEGLEKTTVSRDALTREITDRKRAEEALRRFRAFFEQASVGVAEVDTKSGRFIRVNQKYCDIVGYPAAEMLATTYPKITHPDDLQADLAFVEQLGKGKIRIYSREKPVDFKAAERPGRSQGLERLAAHRALTAKRSGMTKATGIRLNPIFTSIPRPNSAMASVRNAPKNIIPNISFMATDPKILYRS